jgi:hypothetical protein
MMGFGASDVCGLVMSDFQRSGPISMIVHWTLCSPGRVLSIGQHWRSCWFPGWIRPLFHLDENFWGFNLSVSLFLLCFFGFFTVTRSIFHAVIVSSRPV